MKSVRTKKDSYARWQANEFGNRLRVWMSYPDLLASGYTGKIGIRYMEPNSPYCKYDLTIDEVPDQMQTFMMMGADHNKFTFGEAAPDKQILFQGEVMRDHTGLHLFYSRQKSQMRVALKESPEYADGVRALTLLKHFCNPSSYSDLETLIDIYEDHVVEFSCYRINLGNIPGRNTLIWETRLF